MDKNSTDGGRTSVRRRNTFNFTANVDFFDKLMVTVHAHSIGVHNIARE